MKCFAFCCYLFGIANGPEQIDNDFERGLHTYSISSSFISFRIDVTREMRRFVIAMGATSEGDETRKKWFLG